MLRYAVTSFRQKRIISDHLNELLGARRAGVQANTITGAMPFFCCALQLYGFGSFFICCGIYDPVYQECSIHLTNIFRPVNVTFVNSEPFECRKMSFLKVFVFCFDFKLFSPR